MNSLALPLDLSALDRKQLASGTLRHYQAAVMLMLAAGVDPFNRDQLVNYANTLPHSGKANLKAALSIMLDDYVLEAKTSGKPVEDIQRFLWVVDVLKETLHVKAAKRERTPHWLSQEQVNTITAAAYSNSMRDYIIIAVLLGAGLRREELETLTFDALSQRPIRGKMKDILTVTGKGDKTRDIPIDPMLAKHLREWKSETKGGRVARRVYKGGKVGKSLDASRIFIMVRKYGQLLGFDDLAPHDLRRTYGRLMYEATNNIVLVQQLLGHADTKTTLRYIGYDVELDVDFSPVGGLQVAGD